MGCRRGVTGAADLERPSIWQRPVAIAFVALLSVLVVGAGLVLAAGAVAPSRSPLDGSSPVRSRRPARYEADCGPRSAGRVYREPRRRPLRPIPSPGCCSSLASWALGYSPSCAGRFGVVSPIPPPTGRTNHQLELARFLLVREPGSSAPRPARKYFRDGLRGCLPRKSPSSTDSGAAPTPA